MKTIAIIGGGASGALILINILKYHSDAPVAIKWIEKSGEFGIGTAYSTDKDYHLLNVPANGMGIYHDYANDFFEWLLKKGYAYSEHDYVPRKIYADYLKDQLFHHLKNNVSIKIDLIHAEVTDIDIDLENDRYVLSLHNNQKVTGNHVILATGNFLPSNLKLENMDYLSSPNYFRDPWSNELNNNIKRTDDILIIGTGLTMVDKILDLYHQIHKGKIIGISRNGYLPFTHYPCSRHQKYTDYTEELLEAANAKDLFSIIRKHIDLGIKSGIDWRVVVDTIRPALPAIWDRLSLKEKKRFYRHLGSLWTVVRHRIPVICADIIHLLKDKKQLQILGGRIREINSNEKGFLVRYTERESLELKELQVNKIINCTGPQLNPMSTDSVLFKNLFEKGWLCADELGLGFNTLPDGKLLDKKNAVLPEFYTIGNGLKGILFESTAIPEIRLQAYNLAKLLIESTVETV
jgi:uncharacterized NAD(P)/FAD-binding protein YdhS